MNRSVMVYLRITTVGLLVLWQACALHEAAAQATPDEETRIVIDSRGWQLVGDLRLPRSEAPLPAVLMLNKAAGDRTVYTELADHLAARGIASLRLDLPGHGESTNLGRFIPGETDSLARESMIWQSDIDVTAAHEYLKAHARIDANSIGMIGGSYSGEEVAEAGRARGYAQAYVVLSPGSFSEASVRGIDSSGVAWLYIVSKKGRFLQEITASVQAESETVEMVIVPGAEHATNILHAHRGIAERIAVWLAHALR